jgi:glycosyltransferase involved in cell wall biosynthesis
MPAADALRIAVVNQGDPADPAAFSGAPAALLEGLRTAGAEAISVPGALPAPAERALMRTAIAARLRPRDLAGVRAAIARERAPAQLGRLAEAVHDVRLAAGLRAAAPLDGIVQHGTEVRLPGGAVYVTFEDATTICARRHWPWPHMQGSRPADVRRQDARARAVYARARACCAMSRWAADSLVRDFGVPAERVHVVGVGAVRRLRPPAQRDWSVPRLLFVGFAWERKNGPGVLRAFARLREEQPAATLDVVGGHPRLDAPGVTGHGAIALDDAGGEARLQALFDRATCFVMPSLHEPSAQAYIEAATAGIPSIGSTDGGSATVIGPGGVVVDPRDDAAILAAMRSIGSGPRAAELGAAGREHAALLTWPKVAERLIRALRPPGADLEGLAEFL